MNLNFKIFKNLICFFYDTRVIVLIFIKFKKLREYYFINKIVLIIFTCKKLVFFSSVHMKNKYISNIRFVSLIIVIFLLNLFKH